MKKYSIGIDFGTLSGRCILVDVESGEEVATAVTEYKHGVMSEELPDGTRLQLEWALQHPEDYLDVLRTTIREVLQEGNVSPEQIVGIGIDFTSCTMLPTTKEGIPLCMLEEYHSNPHAYVKLWKHHAAQTEADALNEIARVRGEKFLSSYGGKISCEWMVPKIWQILNEDPEIYKTTGYFVEACDWIVFQLSGNMLRNSSSAGYKTIWSKKDGYPSKDFFKALDPRMENIVEEKLNIRVVPVGTRAGFISKEAAILTGLVEGTSVAVAHLDAAGSPVGVGITTPGKMLLVMGTSTCHMLVSNVEREVPGICGMVEDGIIPGFFGYEAGQSCVGDHFQWIVENYVPEEYFSKAKENNLHIHQYLTHLIKNKLPGENGLVALDWWNGNRSILVDGKLSGMIVGCTLQTKVEDIYRALVEATAFGTRKIIETFEEHHVPIDEIYIAGGIAEKNSFIMQVYADVIKKNIKIAGSSQTPALSSAIWASFAAGKENGGFETLQEAVDIMAKVKDVIFTPIEENSQIYDLLYDEYDRLYTYFGRGENNVMKRLKSIAHDQIDKSYRINGG